MEKSIVEFSFEDYQVRTVVGEDGEPWFIARDVCDILEIESTHFALKGLDEDELTLVKLMSGGQNREMKIISESGLYTLIIRSNKPKAKIFRKWVTSEVLPSIRKTGRYEMFGPGAADNAGRLDPEKLAEVGFAARNAALVVKAMNLWHGKRTARLLVNNLVKEATGYDILNRFDASGYLPEGLNARTASTVSGFLLTHCEVAPQEMCRKAELYQAYLDFCVASGERPLSRVRFPQELLSNPAIGSARPRRGHKRPHCYTGISLKQSALAEVVL